MLHNYAGYARPPRSVAQRLTGSACQACAQRLPLAGEARPILTDDAKRPEQARGGESRVMGFGAAYQDALLGAAEIQPSLLPELG